jgi:translation initiation factor 2B subunit (eIF-2B alpha/beta/delta family)
VQKVRQQDSPFLEILRNRTEGASALFYQFVELSEDQTEEVVLAGLNACRNTFPIMAVWRHALAQFKQSECTLSDIANQFRKQTQDTINTGSLALREYQVILTLSNSSVIRHAVASARTTQKVLCAESLPGGEGANQAKALHESGIRATLVKDGDLPGSMQKVQALALGADQWDMSEFINKVGSKNLVDYAELEGIPVLVLAEGFKRIDQLSKPDSSITQLELMSNGKTTQETVFEIVAWRPHVRLISNTEVLLPSTL